MSKPRNTSQPVPTDSSAPTGVQEPPTQTSDDLHDRVAQRAYELYLERGGADGRDFDDWLAAEREVTASRRRWATEDTEE